MRPIRIYEFLYHVLLSGFFSYVTFAHDFPSIRNLTETPLKQHKFLTIHCLYFQVLYYGFATLADLKYFLIGTSNNSYGTRKIRDYLFASIIVPIACTVCIQFWGVYWYDPTLVCKRTAINCILDFTFHNHATHTLPIFATFIELLIVFHQAPSSSKKGALGWCLYITFYISFVYAVHHRFGFWVYPFLGDFSPIERAAFLICNFGIFGLVCCLIGIWLIHNYWKKKDNDNKKRN
uniref:FAR-17a/AIG1-like protein n=1 Tax=Clytia hemisphaerica TaxID=252671 RepID=A0A7M5V9S7_9CNID|eukprot:TCONS_00008641-protein